MDGENLPETRKSRRNRGLEPLNPLLASPSRRRGGPRGRDKPDTGENNAARKLFGEFSDDDDEKSVATVRTNKSKMSIRSATSSQRSLVQQKRLQAEIDSMERVSKLQNELEAKRLERETEIEKKRLELEKLVIDEGLEEIGDEKSVVTLGEVPKREKVSEWLHDMDHENGKSEMGEAKASLENQLAITNTRLERMLARQTVSKELPVFGGNSEEWPMFLRQYQRTTEICGLTDDENMLRLQKALKGKAREAVLPVLGIPENVGAVMETLELMFGRPDQIIETMVQKVRSTPSPKEGKADSLISFSNQVANLVATMQLMNRTGHLYNPTLLNDLVMKLPYQLRFQWCSFNVALKREPNLADLGDWIRGVAMTVSLMPPEVCNTENANNNFNKVKKTVLTAITKDEKSSCLCCSKAGHEITSCNKFLASNEQARWRLVKTKNLCYSCLSSSHRSFECKSKEKCGIDGCIRTHSRLLHKKSVDAKTEGNVEAGADNESRGKSEICGYVSLNHAMKEVLLRVIPVKLSGPKGEVHTFALLDEGSTVTMVDESLSKQLQLSGPKDPLCIQWTNELTKQESNSERVSLRVSGTAEMAKSFTLFNVRTVGKLALPQQSIDMEMIRENWPYLKDVPFRSIFNVRPKILIGSDNILLTTPRKLLQGQWNDPVATKTWLGWVVHGNLVKPQRVDANYSFHVCEGRSADEELTKMVRESFSTEAFGVKVLEKPLRSKEDDRALDILKSTTRRIGDRFETGLLWKNDQIHLPESKSNALRRLQCMERKMDKDPKFADAYCKKIDEFLAKGYCRKLTPEESKKVGPKTNYLPHFAAFNPNKPNKLRLVFDAAAKNHGISLNDCLLRGPDFLNPLPVVLMKFRVHLVAFLADIKEMFPQVKIILEDQDSQRFLWRGKERNRDPDVYIMTSMIFGATSSPASAQYVKNENAMEFEAEFGDLSKAVVEDTYMDDLAHGGSDDEDAIERIKGFIELFRRGGFHICNWASSSKVVMESIPPEFRATGYMELKSEGEFFIERVLGLRWNPEDDDFLFELSFHKVDERVLIGAKTPSKREVLRLVMSLFDPLGFVAHFVIKAKILFQQIWLAKLGWDDPLTATLNETWQWWIQELQQLTQVRVPRCYSKTLTNSDSIQLHTFVDASQEAFAAVSYLRIKTGDLVETAFLMGRTRVAPTKPLSVPRLELQAAVMGARMAEMIRRELRLPVSEVHYWSDSRTVLCWIRSEARNFKQFVGHRIGEILESTEVKDWHWVPTDLNPADDGTRSSKESDLNPSSRWLTGPAFIKSDKDGWPAEPDLKDFSPDEKEMKKDVVLLAAPVIKFSFPPVERFSSWLKTVRTTAWCIRFLENWNLSRRGLPLVKGELSTDELQRSQRLWWKAVQQESFAEDLSRLERGIPVDASSRLRTLSPFIDGDGLLRVRGRTEGAEDLGEETKFPIILDPKHLYTKLLLQHYHEEGGHHGMETVLCSLRQKYWILQMRGAVRSAFFRCQKCKVAKVKPSPPLMGILPEERIQKQLNAFAYSGVDYFGPLMVTVGRHKEKRYGVLFTCLATRAIHLETANDLSTDATIMAVRRFVGRRGLVLRLLSDNGTNFRGADNELKRSIQALDCDEMKARLSRKGIDWRFIPPGSPHMGGCWERMVKSVKVALAATLRTDAPHDDTLHTLMVEAESLVNSRPLTHVSVDPEDPECLTPKHFIQKSGILEGPLGKFTDDDLHLRRQWKRVQRYTDIFWTRWVKEYLPTLTRRTKWHAEGRAIRVGDIVVIADKDGPRNSWPMGRILHVYPGKDGRVRIVDVKTKDGVYKRPATKICILDVKKDDEEKVLPSSGGRNEATRE